MIYRMLSLLVTIMGLVGCLTFVTRYWVLSGGRWRDTYAGRFFVVVYSNLAALFLLIIANQIFGDWPGRKVVSLALYLAYVAQTWWPIRLLSIAQQKPVDLIEPVRKREGQHRREESQS